MYNVRYIVGTCLFCPLDSFDHGGYSLPRFLICEGDFALCDLYCTNVCATQVLHSLFLTLIILWDGSSDRLTMRVQNEPQLLQLFKRITVSLAKSHVGTCDLLSAVGDQPLQQYLLSMCEWKSIGGDDNVYCVYRWMIKPLAKLLCEAVGCTRPGFRCLYMAIVGESLLNHAPTGWLHALRIGGFLSTLFIEYLPINNFTSWPPLLFLGDSAGMKSFSLTLHTILVRRNYVFLYFYSHKGNL